MSQNDDPKSDADEVHESDPDEAQNPNPTTATRPKAGAPPPKAADSNKTLLGMPAPGFDPSSLPGSKAPAPKPVSVPKLSPRAAPKPAAKSKLAARAAAETSKAAPPKGKPPRKRQATLLGVMAPAGPKAAPTTAGIAPAVTAPEALPSAGAERERSPEATDPHDRPTPIMESPHERPTLREGQASESDESETTEGESTQEIGIEDMLAAETPPPPPVAPPPAPAAVARANAPEPEPSPSSAGTTSDWQPSPEPLPANDEVFDEHTDEQIPEHTAPLTAQTPVTARPRQSRTLLFGAATLALVAAVGLAVYAATGRSGPAQPGQTPTAAAPPAQTTASAPPQRIGAKPAEAKPAEKKPAEAKPTAAESAETKPASTEAKAPAADEHGSDEAQAETKPEKPAEKKPAEKKPAARATAARRTGTKAGAIDVPDVPKAIARLPARVRNKRAARMLSAAHRMFRYKKYARAEKLYRKAWQYSPDRADIADGIAVTLQRKGDRAKAIEWEHKAIHLEPHRGAHYFLLGTMLEDDGHVAAARRAYRKAIALSPRDKRPRYRLRQLRAKH